MSFSNRVISIISRGEADFVKAMSFFFENESATVKMYLVDPKHGLILFWAEPSNGKAQKLPYEMNQKAATQFAWNWLQSNAAAALLGPQPDHDGDNEVGWRVYNEDWTHVANYWEATVAIKPIWAMYGK